MLRVKEIELLNNWKRYTLQEMLDASIITSHLDGNHGELYPKKEEFTKKGVPYLSANCIENGEVDFSKAKYLSRDRAKLFNKGVAQNDDVLFAHNATVGPVAILKTDLEFVILSTTLTYYRCNKKYLLPNYLRLYMLSEFFVDQYTEVMRQATRNQVPITKQRTFVFLVPPLAEQKRIVEILDETFAAIDKAKANISTNLQNAKELFESYLQNVFANKGDDWEEKQLNKAFEIKPSKSEVRNKLNENDLVSFLPMEDLNILAHEIKSTRERALKEVIGSYTYFADDDVLLAKITPCFENGKIGVAKNLTNGVGFGSSEYLVFRSNETIIPEYLYYFLSRKAFRNEGRKRMTGAVGHKRVSKEFIEEYSITFPKSIKEQQNIVDNFNKLSTETKKLENIYQQKLNDLEELKKSILQKAFNGELTKSRKEYIMEQPTLSIAAEPEAVYKK